MKKFLPYIFILIILVGLFSSSKNANAQLCYQSNGAPIPLSVIGSKDSCEVANSGRIWSATPPTPDGKPTLPDGVAQQTPTPAQPNQPVNTDTTYTLLAPIPGFGIDANGKTIPFETDPTKNPCAFGKYMNILINLIIGFAAVLAVIMIIAGGLEYMTSELVSSKESGKDRIGNALLGLIIALGAWALLNTLNPELLNVCLKLPEAKIAIMDEGEESFADAVQNDMGAPSGPAPLCPEGIQRTNSGMYACGSIAQNLDRMIVAARSAGLNITGGGYRTVEAQRALRIRNCGGNETDRNANCRPPTAVPGASRHNNGLAFDLKCDGVLIQNNTNACFVWLKANANSYGLFNLKSEQWHWSVDGK